MKVAMTGASGLIGTRLCADLRDDGHEIIPMLRSERSAAGQGIYWNPAGGEIDAAGLEDFELVVHLAGENVGAGRWSAARREAIRASRVDGTKLLATALAGLSRPPKTLVCASAIGFYGDRGSDLLDEHSDAGRGFLPEVCTAWEAATRPAVDAGIRVVNARIGVVLASEGGALARMLTPFRMGLGGVVGSGEQYVSWISLADVSRALRHCLLTPSLRGPVNAVAPHPVTNRALTRALGRALHRPTIVPLPTFVVHAVFGEMGEALLLASARVAPTLLVDSGFEFLHADVEAALQAALART